MFIDLNVRKSLLNTYVDYNNITWAFKLLVYYVYEILQQVNMKIIIND